MPSSHKRDQAIRLAGEQLQGALLVSLLRRFAERDQDRDPSESMYRTPRA